MHNYKLNVIIKRGYNRTVFSRGTLEIEFFFKKLHNISYKSNVEISKFELDNPRPATEGPFNRLKALKKDSGDFITLMEWFTAARKKQEPVSRSLLKWIVDFLETDQIWVKS